MDKNKKARGSHLEFPLEDSACLTGTLSGAVSGTDCTGMIPIGSVDNAEEFGTSNRLHKYSEEAKKKR
ncbi:MAG: hypothetical protein IJT87_02975 [Ruminiclostridium sp.]|nr:hypothetical protein [Ruminiclostridium sp.]